jgi:16S rRNA (guanine1516-N2)-methyltransferase
MRVDGALRAAGAAAAARAGLVLEEAEGALVLRAPGRRLRPLRVDLVAALAAHRPGAQALVRALRPARCVVDLTAGLLGDALRLAAAGKRVHAIERHPTVAALAADGVARLRESQPDLAAAITLHVGDARVLLPAIAGPAAPDGALLDPMFPAERAGAARRELALLRELAGDDADAPALLAAARVHVRARVAVKRPRLAPPLAPDPEFVVPGRSVRFDVYRGAP